MEHAVHAGDEVTVTWLAHKSDEWTARGRVEEIDERYIRLRDLSMGLTLIPCSAIRSLVSHGPCAWGPPYRGGRPTWKDKRRDL